MKPAPAIVAAAPLSPKEHARLDRCEHAIEAAERGFWDIGKALREIRDAKLYRPTWEAYCLKRWEFGDCRASQLMAAAEVMDNLKARKPTNCRVLPTNESQARALCDLDPEQQVEAWVRAVELSKGRPTGQAVARAVEELFGRPPGAAPGEVSEETAALLASMTPEQRIALMEEKEAEAAAAAPASTGRSRGPADVGGKFSAVLDKFEGYVDKYVDRLDVQPIVERLERLLKVLRERKSA